MKLKKTMAEREKRGKLHGEEDVLFIGPHENLPVGTVASGTTALGSGTTA